MAIYRRNNATINTVKSYIMLLSGSIGMDHVISKSCYKGTILQRNYKKMTILWSFSYNSLIKFHGKIIWELQHGCVISKSVLKQVLYCTSPIGVAVG